MLPMPDPRSSGAADDLVAIETTSAGKTARDDTDSTLLILPFRFMSEGRERMMTTLADATVFLTEHHPFRATADEWQRAIEAVTAARSECSERRRRLATNMVQNICYIEGILRN
jgi:hypothetical protein